MAVSGVTVVDPEVRPGPVDFNRTHVELLRWIGSHYFRLEPSRILRVEGRGAGRASFPAASRVGLAV